MKIQLEFISFKIKQFKFIADKEKDTICEFLFLNLANQLAVFALCRFSRASS